MSGGMVPFIRVGSGRSDGQGWRVKEIIRLSREAADLEAQGRLEAADDRRVWRDMLLMSESDNPEDLDGGEGAA